MFRQLNCVIMLNWIVWNGTDYLLKMDLALNNKGWYATKPNQPTNLTGTTTPGRSRPGSNGNEVVFYIL